MTENTDPHAELRNQLRNIGYVAGPDLVSSLHLMDVLGKPLLIEGEAGVGKTEQTPIAGDTDGRQNERQQRSANTKGSRLQ